MATISDKALYGRRYRLVVGPSTSPNALDVSNLDIEFSVKKSLKHEPNTADIKIYNLSEDSRKILEGDGTFRNVSVSKKKALQLDTKKLIVKLEAGYISGTSIIYLGEVRSAFSYREGADIITEMNTGDGEKAVKLSRINVSFGPKTPPDVTLRAIVKALGVGQGNIETAVQTLRHKGLASLGAKGFVLSGSAAREMTDFCKSADLEWSIQDGKIQILDKGKALEDKAIELSSDTGLIGSPVVDNQGYLNCTTLMIPEMRPGRKLSLNSTSFKGGYRVQECEYSGNSTGQDWYCKVTAKKY